MSSKYDGAGLVAGLDSEWDIACGFSVYADVSAALLYGQFRSSSRQISRVEDEVFGDVKLHDRFNACVPVTDLALGLRWKPVFECFCTPISPIVDLGWEQHVFFDQNRFIDMRNCDAPSSRGNLSLTGLTLSLGVEF